MRVASGGIAVEASGPAATIRPARVTTVAWGTGASLVPRMSVAPVNASVPALRPGKEALSSSSSRHLVACRARDEREERGFQVVADRLEVIELGIARDQRRQRSVAIHPERFDAPHQSLDAVAVEGDGTPVHGDRVSAARANLHMARRKCRQGRW